MAVTMAAEKRIYWYRELPPLRDRIEGEHRITARSDEVAYDRLHRDQLWGQCFPSLERAVEHRLLQEIERQGGHCAHVDEEHVHEKIDHATRTYHLEGEYIYVLYLAPEGVDE